MGRFGSLYKRAVERMGIRKKPGLDVINEGLMKKSDPKFDNFFKVLSKIANGQTVNGLLSSGRFNDVEEEDVSKVLIWCMREENETVMRAASNEIYLRKDTSAVPELIEIAKEGSGLRSEKALSILGYFKAEDALPQIMEIYRDSGSTAALRAIGAIGSFAATGLLTSRLSASPERDNLLIFEMLGSIGDPAAVPAIAEHSDDENEEVRRAAIMALAEIGSDSTLEILIQSVSDRNCEIRRIAAKGLGKVGNSAAVPSLIKGFQNYSNSEGRIDSTDDPRLMMVWALGEIEDASAIDPLFSGADEDPDKDVRAECVRSLGKIGGIETSYFTDRLAHPSMAMRDAAESAVRKIDCVADLYCGFITTPDYDTRQAIIRLLKQIIYDSRSPELIQEFLVQWDAAVEKAQTLDSAENLTANELHFRSEAVFNLAKEKEAEYTEKDLKRREEIRKSITRKRAVEAEMQLRRMEDSDD